MTVIKVRRGTAMEWRLADPLLADGEPGYETDTSGFKVGDGKRRWSALPYMVAEAAPDAATAAANSSSRAAALGELVARLKNGEALNLGVSSSSSFVGFGLPMDKGAGVQCWKQVLAKYGNTSSAVHNLGASGARSGQLWAGGNSPEIMSTEAAVRSFDLDAVIVQINFNDGGTISPETYGEYMRKTYLAARRSAATVLVVPPLAYGPYWNASWAQGYRRAVYVACARAGAVVFPIEESLANAERTGIDPTLYQSDATHPNETGAARYGEAFASMWPSTYTAAAVTPAGRGEFLSPNIRGPFIEWVDSLGADKRTTSFRMSEDKDARPASRAISVPEPLFARGTVAALDGTTGVDGNLIEVSAEFTDGRISLGLAPPVSGFSAPQVLAGGGLGFGGSGQVVQVAAPPASRSRLLFGRDDVTIRFVLRAAQSGDASHPTRSIISRGFDGGSGFKVGISAAGRLIVTMGSATTEVSSVVTQGSHLITLSALAGSDRFVAYVGGEAVGGGVIESVADPEVDWLLGASRDQGGQPRLDSSFAGEVHWLNIAHSFVNPIEQRRWYDRVAKPYFNGLDGRQISLA
ncbi:GDSL-type esterase/lipase family protein [Nocardioides sp.]|uniref:GDSL-type esterase/lipase family protein n=1 Tax=Nocardioides sp. TaxID=35761 RepID=UPI00271FE292|nr:GDSL-type esterase/lipase family protein [Nocardioides sp.]MDO9454981.1 GDSL-type esterase/lipase family protein [Nocardioides sp.]